MEGVKQINNFLHIREQFQRTVYQDMIIETEELFKNNPQMTKLKKKVAERLKLIEQYDAAAIKALASFHPEILEMLQQETAIEKQITTDDLKARYE